MDLNLLHSPQNLRTYNLPTWASWVAAIDRPVPQAYSQAFLTANCHCLCPGLLTTVMINNISQSNLRIEKALFGLLFRITAPQLRKVRTGTQNRNLVAGTEAELMEENSLLAFFPGFLQLPLVESPGTSAKWWCHPERVGLSYINKKPIPHTHVHRPTWQTRCINSYSLFPDQSRFVSRWQKLQYFIYVNFGTQGHHLKPYPFHFLSLRSYANTVL